MKYRIVSNGLHYRILYKDAWYSFWKHLREINPYHSNPIATFNSLEEAEMFVESHLTEVLKFKRKYKTVKEFDISKLEIAIKK